ncbi:bile acid:sodium symporter [uncultured Maricaulis sp.]|uniref:bile acid:sodium symporter family protein n=1 Tax=uncultured Maricaulis sp. TaxID=174710 RepID=UPI0030DBC0EB|tara:strand:+ start:147589 stop:148539 length:951 start_codon:yes stop_codon:yes gene_type:complete
MDAVAIDDLRVVLNDQIRAAIALILIGMMFTVALSLRLEDFGALRRQPVRILGGVAAQIFGLPLVTMGLILILSPPASIALGMIVVGCCPGGNVSNILTDFARGNTAYSVSLTAISSVSSAIATPVSILVWASLYPPTAALVRTLDVDALPFLTQTLLLLALPLAVGMLVAAKFPRAAAAMRKVLSPLSLLSLVALIAVGLQQNWSVLLVAGAVVVPIAVIHNASALALGAGTARLLRLDIARRRALTFEVGIQNSGLGLLILLNQFDGIGGAAVMTAFWGIWHLVSGGTLVGLFRTLDWVHKGDKQKSTIMDAEG